MKKYTLLSLLLLPGILAFAQLTPTHLLCENLYDPIAIDATQPRFTWVLEAEGRNPGRWLAQSAYEIRVAAEGVSLEKASSEKAWSSGKVMGDQSVHVVYTGGPLKSGQRYHWQVRVWDAKGKPGHWSETASFRMALLDKADWKAQWIEPGYVEDSIARPSPFFRKTFAIKKRLRTAIAYITAHGLYDANINGKRIGDAVLTPGWTSYNKRLQYQAYDITNLLKQGDNAVGVMLGNGWYRGYLAWGGQHNIYGKTLGLLFQLQLTYTDGSTETVVSDNSWKSSTGEIVYSEIYNGEIIDARKQKPGWTTAGYDDTRWSGVTLPGMTLDNLVATWNEPVKKHEVLHPQRIFKTPAGELVADFGQNMVGWVHVTAKGHAGDSIKIFHAEVLDKKGNFYTTNLRAAKQEDIYILNGSGEESFEPHFTWQGFRYIRVEGYPGELKPEDLYATVLYSDMPKTGSFSCSDSLLNQLQHNIEWGQRGNFLDVPTDCPQRDERLGWTGDAQVFSRTASYLRNVDNFFAKWLCDVAADQMPGGAVPHVIPNVLGKTDGGSTGWSDVSTIVPWNMYLAYGDKRILERQYPSMKAWIGYMVEQSHDYLWNTGGHFGDWLFYWPEGHGERAAITDSYLIAQTFFAYSTQLVINAARVLGHSEDVAHYSDILQKVKAAFLREYATPDGRLVSNTQTAYVLALQFDMLPENIRQAAAGRLVQNIRDYNNHLTTGFLGTPYLCHVLSRFGYSDVAYTLLLQQTYPSWLYPVKMGATTIWERWDGEKTDSTFEDAGMNSFNHYAYGAVGDWLYRVAAGIDTYDSAPGYKKIRIMPHLTDSLTFMNADLDTYYGRISSHWQHTAAGLTLDVAIPINTTATVYIPSNDQSDVLESGQPLSTHPEIKPVGHENGYTVVEIGSGHYHFTRQAVEKRTTKAPHIVNIVNFIRLLEPRDPNITEDVLYQTVASQIKLMRENHLGGTFLLQYDALMNPRYQQLLKSLPDSNFEIGAWWEITQPHVERAGLRWRGRYPWDWDANVDFSTGYSTSERERLVDVYMEDFKKIYGRYPASVGSWFIDSYTLDYMYRKYGIVASCNCKDQIGTDGYTLWGGYWNQGYYPSLKNAYMPAQTAAGQLPVPVFRMLGSDPIRQYESGLGSNGQGVITLEPSYPYGGGDSAWVHWYFDQFVHGACMSYAYVQAGQENSFTWQGMQKGLEIQFPLIARLRDSGLVRVETLGEAGRWFKKNFKLTPPTAVTVDKDINGDKKAIWFDSRFFRLSIAWEAGKLRIRDLHLFDENISDNIKKDSATGSYALLTLPFVDGFVWSDKTHRAGIRLKGLVNGTETDLEGGDPIITDSIPGKLRIVWPLATAKENFVIDVDERHIKMQMEGKAPGQWWLELSTAPKAVLPFTIIDPKAVHAVFHGTPYTIHATKGQFEKPAEGSFLRITPQTQSIVLTV